MVPLDRNAARSNATDRLSILESHQMELDFERHPQISSRCPLDPRRIRRALQHHYDLLARLCRDEHRRDICRVSWTDQCALSSCPNPTVLFFLRVVWVILNGISLY